MVISTRDLTTIVVAGVLAWATATPAADGPRVGEVLGPETAASADGLLPPEIFAHYQKGEYRNAVMAWPADVYNWPEDLKAATAVNQGRYKLGETGEILDASTGTPPAYVFGFPFPTIDPADPEAGTKVVWNYFYHTWYMGNVHAESQVNWVSQKALERRSDQNVRFMFFDGVPEAERVPNPQNFLSQSLIAVTGPADLNGTAALTWRYRDAGKRDSAWSYVPALRRVRAVSPSNRSDGFLGSDMSQDDGPFFDGKPEDFTWSFKEKREELTVVDPGNLRGEAKSVWVGSHWRAEWPALKYIGYMDPEWKGVAWAPATAAVAKRPVWVVEGVPRDRYYLFGRLELHIDAVGYHGAWNRKFGWKDELLNTMQVMGWNPVTETRPDGRKNWTQGSTQAFQVAENVKGARATVAGVRSGPTAVFDGRVRFDPALFDMDALARHGK